MAEYYMPAEDEGRIRQLINWRKTKRRPRPSFPRAVQIQTTSLCNARCVFCGYMDTYKVLPQGHMDDDLFKKIADECCSHYVGRISTYLMNEPLVDPKQAERLAYINRKKKFVTKTKINTNGALMTPDVSEALIESGLRHVWVSVQGYSEDTYRQSMGLSLTKVLDNIDALLDLKEKKNAKFPKVSVTTLDTKIVHDEIEYARKYWADRDVRFKIHHVDNRRGTDLGELSMHEQKLKRNCDLFLKQAYILYNGDMIICCHDWRRTVVLGNVREQSISEIWNSDRFKRIIREYQAGNYRNCKVCAKCFVS